MPDLRSFPTHAWCVTITHHYPARPDRKETEGPFWSKGACTSAANRRKKWLAHDNMIGKRQADEKGQEYTPITLTYVIEKAPLNWQEHTQ